VNASDGSAAVVYRDFLDALAATARANVSIFSIDRRGLGLVAEDAIGLATLDGQSAWLNAPPTGGSERKHGDRFRPDWSAQRRTAHLAAKSSVARRGDRWVGRHQSQRLHRVLHTDRPRQQLVLRARLLSLLEEAGQQAAPHRGQSVTPGNDGARAARILSAESKADTAIRR
jgi:hypothetical protein